MYDLEKFRKENNTKIFKEFKVKQTWTKQNPFIK